MSIDVTRLIEFYQSPLGSIVRDLVCGQVMALAGDIKDKRILGLGFATPYLRFTLATAERVLVFMPARQGASVWPREAPSHTVLCDPLEMPLTDAAIDLTIAIHALEHVADAEELMREFWRITAPNGQVLLVVPRRRGIWAQRDNTPFGSGNPYSARQLDRLLRSHGFIPEAWRDSLFLPPVSLPPVLKSAHFLERMGPLFVPAIGGVICVSARKQAFPAIPRRKYEMRFVRLPNFKVAPARHGQAIIPSPSPSRNGLS